MKLKIQVLYLIYEKNRHFKGTKFNGEIWDEIYAYFNKVYCQWAPITENCIEQRFYYLGRN